MDDAVKLSGPIVLVPGRQLAAKLVATRQQFPHVPEPPALVRELNRLTANGGVPAAFDTSQQGNRWLRLYTARASLGLRPSPRNDAWVIEFVDPLRLRDHRTISQGALRLAPSGWYYHPILAQLQPRHSNHQARIEHAWTALRAAAPRPDAPQAPATPVRYERFCADLEEVIEAGRQIDNAKQRDAPPIPYYAVESTAEQRYSAKGIYVFRLKQPGRVEKGALVELRHAPDLRGTVRRADGDRLTVRFAKNVDRARITEQGELVVSFNPVVPRVQQDAVCLLRDGAAVHPRLLPLLVDGAFTAPPASTETLTPDERLDPDQLDAFVRALAGPELLLVLGPPGTGKTRTIVQIAQACAARGERVLVTSHTNTAVDNVLERLPAQVRGLRVGNDDRISPAVRHQTLPVVAASLQQQILDRTSASADALQPWLTDPSPASAWLGQLGKALGEVRQAQQHREAAGQVRRAEVQRVQAAHQPRLDSADRAATLARQLQNAAAARVHHTNARLAKAHRRANGPLGFVFQPIARRHARRLADAEATAAATIQHLAARERDFAVARADLAAATADDPGVRQAAQRVRLADAAVTRTLDQAKRAAGELRRLLAGVIPVRSGISKDAVGLTAFMEWCQQIQPQVRARAALLRDWRAKLAEPTEDLHHELVRYADVIGATCIGAGVGSNLISDLEFDLAVIDEAGQISMPSALVPLVRARRAILVGDHHQLPPFVDDEVTEWLAHQPRADADNGRRLTELLTSSAFERLYRSAPHTHRVALRWQRRMPAVIADFVSKQFYADELRTKADLVPAPPPFGRPLAIVDTGDLPADKRAERERKRTETWQVAGYDNPAEARLIIDLIQWYAGTGRTWAVIVPYRAQVQLLSARLASMLGDETLVATNVGTVDAFQGGERDIICYGFTRSNQARQVGFLKELRRINVAITRARQQLVLIGDFTTLRAARDPGFRTLIQALERHAARHGEVHRSSALSDLLRRAWQEAR